MRAALLATALLLQASALAAQLSSAPFWEHAAPRSLGGVRLLSAASLTSFSTTTATTQLVSSATLRVSGLTATLHAGALHDPNSVSAAGATISTQFHLLGARLDVRAGAGAAPDEHRGPSITSVAAALAGKGLALSLRSSLLPPTQQQTYQTRVTERDTTYFLNHIVPGQPRRAYTDVELSYQRAFNHVTLDAAVGHRMGANVEGSYWLRGSALVSVTSGFAVGGGIARDPGSPWLQTGARNAFSVFVRVDPLRRDPEPHDIPIRARVHPLRVTTGAMTTFAFLAPRAKLVEIAGTFSDWQPVALRRNARGEWSIALPLAPGVYRIALRIDGKAWRAPPGLASIPDEFGGEAGIFEVR